jgi:hypothetical protein
MPQDLKLELNELNPKEAMKAAAFLATVVGFAHARQMDGRKTLMPLSGCGLRWSDSSSSTKGPTLNIAAASPSRTPRREHHP